MTESPPIALASGGVLGLEVGDAGMTLFRQIEIPTELPVALAFQVDRRALVFSLIVAAGRPHAQAGRSGAAYFWAKRGVKLLGIPGSRWRQIAVSADPVHAKSQHFSHQGLNFVRIFGGF